jgi:hypothetical protein
MRWRDKYRDYSRPKRPKARRLTKEQQERLLKTFTANVQQSPVLVALGCQISAARGRFYVDRISDDEEERWGRITPLDGSRQYLLERERRPDLGRLHNSAQCQRDDRNGGSMDRQT